MRLKWFKDPMPSCPKSVSTHLLWPRDKLNFGYETILTNDDTHDAWSLGDLFTQVALFVYVSRRLPADGNEAPVWDLGLLVICGLGYGFQLTPKPSLANGRILAHSPR